ncbi:MAG TPA: hypothetical protein VJX67_18795 [Blastocatellia bacterium]|nr:hypothetical protein [Blastocatellia bacterium]
MGGHPWLYLVPYQEDINKALQDLRLREFAAGRYSPVLPFLEFPIGDWSPAPGPQHASIKDALEAAMEDGTKSILDMESVSAEPKPSAVSPLDFKDLIVLFGTDRPTHEMIEDSDMDFFEHIGRGQGIYIVIYRGGKPIEIAFAGYSFD